MNRSLGWTTAAAAAGVWLVLGLVAPARGLAGPKPTVAVLYFDYDGKDDDLVALRKGLAQMMISDLSGIDAVQLVERSRLEDVLAELKLAQDHKIDAASAAKAGKLLGARYLVLGGYFELKSKLRVDARVVEVETGKLVQSVGATGGADDCLAIEQKLVGDVGAVLAKQLAVPAKAAQAAPRVTPPARLARRTAVLYGRALRDADTGNNPRAQEELKQVVKDQPDFKLAMADLDKLMQ
ncbi:MAG TPA: CsgG/HfaB family protein [Kofleriaceae bacterium]|jgi:TolB-like protein|nr:CsgG/HfaB family protein [Kofleriaceae bacterium]